MNLIGLFGNSILLGGSSSASFSNFFPFFIIFLNNMRSSLLAWKTGPLGTEYELLLQRKGGKAKSILPLAVILFIFFFTLHIFSIFHLLFFECKKPSWLHSHCHMCPLFFLYKSPFLCLSSVLFWLPHHNPPPPIPLSSLAPHITLQLFLSASLPSLSFIHWLHLCSISYAALSLSPSHSSAHPLTG